MKIRLLKEMLDTDYIVHCDDTKIYVGTMLVPDIIYVDTKTLEVVTDVNFNSLILSNELYLIIDKLKQIVNSGLLKDIVNGDDCLEDFFVTIYNVEKDGKLIKSTTEYNDWPSITNRGRLIYDNMYFENEIDALTNYIEKTEKSIDYTKCEISRIGKIKEELESRLDDLIHNIKNAEILRDSKL
jgi:hypothetical protein